MCVCVYDRLGSQRVTEPEFDEGTAVVSKGGWGLFPRITCSVSHKLYFYLWCCFGDRLAGTGVFISEQQRNPYICDRMYTIQEKQPFYW